MSSRRAILSESHVPPFLMFIRSSWSSDRRSSCRRTFRRGCSCTAADWVVIATSINIITTHEHVNASELSRIGSDRSMNWGQYYNGKHETHLSQIERFVAAACAIGSLMQIWVDPPEPCVCCWWVRVSMPPKKEKRRNEKGQRCLSSDTSCPFCIAPQEALLTQLSQRLPLLCLARSPQRIVSIIGWSLLLGPS